MKKTLSKAISALIIATTLLVFVTVLPTIPFAHALVLPYFSVSPPTYVASSLGEVFDISVMVNNLEAGWQAVGFEFRLSYNASILNFQQAYEGPWLPPFAAPPDMGTLFIRNFGTDYVQIDDIVMSDVNGTWHAPFPTGTGVLAIIQFSATAQNVFPLPDLTCTLHLNATKIADSNSTLIPEDPSQDGSYSISSSRPAGVHDVAVTDVTTDRAWVYQGFSTNINVTVLNKGDFNENVAVTLYYNITANKIIGSQNVTLSQGQNKTVAFVWDTTGVPYCHNYTITANATIPVDNNPTDNTLADGPIKVRIPGDINGDGSVNVLDAIQFGTYFGLQQGDTGWNADADINRDGKTNILDIIIVAEYFGKSGSS
jgi:hypothetical protein